MANFHFYDAIALLYFLLVPSRVLAQNCSSNHGVVFLFPPSGEAFNYKSAVNVSWTSHFTDPLLYTFCSNSTSLDVQEQLTQVDSFNASLLVQLEWPDMDTCFFDLRPNTSACYGANSPTFSIIQDAVAATTYGLTSTATGSTTSAQTTSTGLSTASSSTVPATVTVTVSSTNSPTSSAVLSKSELSTGAKAGIGVGVALGAVGAVAGVASFFLRRKNIPKGIYELAGDPAGVQELKGWWYGRSKPQSKSSHTVPPVSYELQTGSERMRQEMSAENEMGSPGQTPS